MSRRQLFHASDLARTLKVAQQAGLTIARVEIEPSGKIVIVSQQSTSDDSRGEVLAELEALRKRGAERRAERLARKNQASAKLGARLPRVKERNDRL